MRFHPICALLLCGCSGIAAQAIVGPLGGGGNVVEPGQPIDLLAGGVPLHGFLLRPPSPPRGTALLLHGQGARAAFWRDEAQVLAARGIQVLAFDNRGHGRSGGYCTFGAREREDVTAGLDALERANLLVRPIILYGYSMGAGVAIQAAAADLRIDGVLAVAPFATLEALLRRVIWAVPRRAFERVVAAAEERAHFRVAEVRPVEAARRLAVPLVVVAGADDQRSPPADAQAIANAAPSGRLVLIPEANHQDILERCRVRCGEELTRLFAEFW